MDLSKPGNNKFFFKVGSKNGTIDFIVGEELKFISSAIKIQPFWAASINGPSYCSIFWPLRFIVPYNSFILVFLWKGKNL